MGNCCTSSKQDYKSRIFTKTITIDVKTSLASEKLKFTMTSALKAGTSLFSSSNLDLKSTFCVLPGQDPRGLISKVCQDQLFTERKSEALLTGVFDGHGKNGQQVVNFCTEFMRSYFLKNDFQDSVQTSLTSMIEECDKALLQESKINCSTSGTTAVLVLFTNHGIWTCSVGDSRAVLGTLPKYMKIVEIIEKRTEEYKVPVVPARVLKAVQMTLDQKPNISYELERIKKSGGVVSQAMNSEGKKIGPYRIWKPETQIPGLAMSRSLGDSIAKKLGVISKPILYYFEICTVRDLFVVIATDGVWDVMDNQEVCNFVDKYKELCVDISVKDKPNVSESNSCVAEFLCEEARYRWLGICKNEDVPIDDISALVVEIKPKKHFVTPSMKRKGITNEQILEPLADTQEIIIGERFDLKRGSNAVILEDSGEDQDE
jgi:serine/threonine protein phosphatase PrpC